MQSRIILKIVIATISTTASNSDIRAESAEIIGGNPPTVSVFAGVNFKVSLFELWRFEPFLEIGQYVQPLKTGSPESPGSLIIRCENGQIRQGGEQFFPLTSVIGLGADFRITDRNRIRLLGRYSFTTPLQTIHPAIHINDIAIGLGYVHRLNFTPRASIDLYAKYIVGWRELEGGTRRQWFHANNPDIPVENNIWATFSGNYGGVEAGATFNYRMTQNLNLTFDIRYFGKLNAIIQNSFENIESRHILTASVGLHYRIPLREVEDISGGRRPPARNQALPCPPGQLILR